MPDSVPDRSWPALPAEAWTDTLETLHMWTQIVGKIRMVQSPWLNHSWGVTLYVSPTGLTTSLVPYGSEGFELAFDFLADEIVLATSTGERRTIALAPRTVADFHAELMEAMASAGMPVKIHPVPCEVPDAIPFPKDTTHSSYDGEHVRALWRALLQAHRVFTRFRAGFLGKASPVHFFWGSFDLAVTRFSGRTAPPHSGGILNFPDDVAREAYSHEVTSCGFWPGNRDAKTPIFYAYAYPNPEGFAEARIDPPEAFWLAELGEFALPYDAVREAADPDHHLLSFLESTHAAAAGLAGWDRSVLECSEPRGPDWWHTRGARNAGGVGTHCPRHRPRKLGGLQLPRAGVVIGAQSTSAGRRLWAGPASRAQLGGQESEKEVSGLPYWYHYRIDSAVGEERC